MSKHMHSSNAAMACIQSMVELACCIPTMAGRSERKQRSVDAALTPGHLCFYFGDRSSDEIFAL